MADPLEEKRLAMLGAEGVPQTLIDRALRTYFNCSYRELLEDVPPEEIAQALHVLDVEALIARQSAQDAQEKAGRG